jgi:hypothetical protein
MTCTEWLRARLLHRARLLVDDDLEAICTQQWDVAFEQLVLRRVLPAVADLSCFGINAAQDVQRALRFMKARLVMGYYRYGGIRDPSARPWDNISSAIERLQSYLKDGNLEHLVDAANLCLVEWVKGPRGLGSHPHPRWAPTDDGRHTKLRTEHGTSV